MFLLVELLLTDLNSCDFFSVSVTLEDKALSIDHHSADDLKEAVRHKMFLSLQKF
jgi:hypothetical protein